MTPPESDIRVIGVGNTFRCDDGAGIAVVQHLRNQTTDGIALIEESGEGTSLMEAWKGGTAVILIDAAHSSAAPGAIFRFDASEEEIPQQVFHCSTHAFGVSDAIQLARVLNQLPARLIVYGIQGEYFGDGLELSPEVQRASMTVAAQVLEDIRSLQEGGRSCTKCL